MSIYDHLSKGSFRDQMLEAYGRQAARRQSKQIHSTYWMPEIGKYAVRYEENPELRHDPEYIMALSNIRRGVANFVHIITGRSIPVHFSTGQQSYAGKRNTQEAIVISATMDPHKLDVNVGLALHEAAHLILSKYDPRIEHSIPLFELLDIVWDTNNILFPPAILKNMVRLKMSELAARQLLKTILNVLEDRRIDEWMYRKAKGYRRYYDAMYAHYWNSEKVAERMKSPVAKEPLVRVYRFHMTNLMNPDFDSSALPGLDDIYDLIDIDNIRRFGTDKKWRTYRASCYPEMLPDLKTVKGEKGINGKRSGRTFYPLMQLPDMVQTAVGIIEIILEHAKPEDEFKKLDLPTLDMDPIQVKGLGLDEEDENIESPFPSIPVFDPANLDVADFGDNAKANAGADQQKPSDSDDEDAEDIDEDGAAEDDEDEEDIDEEDNDLDDEDEDTILDDDLDEEDEAGPDTRTKEEIFDDELNEFDKVGKEHEQFMDGTIEKEVIDKKIEDQLTTLEEAGTEIKEVNDGDMPGATKVIVYNKMTETLINTPEFAFSTGLRSRVLEDAVQDGLRMGNMIAHRLQIMADEAPLDFVRQSAGRLDKRMLSGLGYGSEQVFKSTQIEHTAPVFLHLSIDSSNSMQGEKFENSLRLAACMVQAAKKISTLEVVVSIRSSPPSSDYPEVVIIFDSRTDSIEKVRTLWPYLRTNGGTPEGLAFSAIRESIIGVHNGGQKFFVNLSDGFPDHSYHTHEATINGKSKKKWVRYGGKRSWEHTARVVQDMRAAGIRVLSYLIVADTTYDTPEAQKAFFIMYGASATVIDPTSVPAIAMTLNKLFLPES